MFAQKAKSKCGLHISLIFSWSVTIIAHTYAIDPDHDISDCHYYDNYTECSYYCSN